MFFLLLILLYSTDRLVKREIMKSSQRHFDVTYLLLRKLFYINFRNNENNDKIDWRYEPSRRVGIFFIGVCVVLIGKS